MCIRDRHRRSELCYADMPVAAARCQAYVNFYGATQELNATGLYTDHGCAPAAAIGWFKRRCGALGAIVSTFGNHALDSVWFYMPEPDYVFQAQREYDGCHKTFAERAAVSPQLSVPAAAAYDELRLRGDVPLPADWVRQSFVKSWKLGISVYVD